MAVANRIDRMRSSLFAAASIVLFLVVGCTTVVVHMGSPYDRYDHNRTRAIVISATTGSAETVGVGSVRGLRKHCFVPFIQQKVALWTGKGRQTDPQGALSCYFALVTKNIGSVGTKTFLPCFLDAAVRGRPWRERFPRPI